MVSLKSIVAVSNDCVNIGCLIFTICFVLTHFLFLVLTHELFILGIMQIQPSSSAENSSSMIGKFVEYALNNCFIFSNIS